MEEDEGAGGGRGWGAGGGGGGGEGTFFFEGVGPTYQLVFLLEWIFLEVKVEL